VVARWEGEFIDNYVAPPDLLTVEPAAASHHA